MAIKITPEQMKRIVLRIIAVLMEEFDDGGRGIMRILRWLVERFVNVQLDKIDDSKEALLKNLISDMAANAALANSADDIIQSCLVEHDAENPII